MQHLSSVKSPLQHGLPFVALPVRQHDSHVKGASKQRPSLAQTADDKGADVTLTVHALQVAGQLSRMYSADSPVHSPFAFHEAHAGFRSTHPIMSGSIGTEDGAGVNTGTGAGVGAGLQQRSCV